MARNALAPYRNVGLLGAGIDDMFSLHRDINRLFDQVLGGTEVGAISGASILNTRMNVSETEQDVRLTAELPGVAEDDIDISLDDDLLTIRAEKRVEKRDDRESFHVMERAYGTFQRSLRLPFVVDPAAVNARFENGVLTVTMPKAEAQRRIRRIELQRGTGQPNGEHVQNDSQDIAPEAKTHESRSPQGRL